MRIVVVGGSKFGIATVEQLIEHEHDVVLVDKDRQKLESLSERLDCGMIEGDGSSPSVLREAFSDENDVLIALTNASDDNILTALVGRSIGFGRVIPQIISPELLEVCAELDLTDTITPHVTVARSLCKALEEDSEVTEELNLNADLRLKRFEVGEKLDGTTIGDLDVPENAKAIAVIQKEKERLAAPDVTLHKGNHVLFVVSADELDALKACFD